MCSHSDDCRRHAARKGWVFRPKLLASGIWFSRGVIIGLKYHESALMAIFVVGLVTVDVLVGG